MYVIGWYVFCFSL